MLFKRKKIAHRVALQGERRGSPNWDGPSIHHGCLYKTQQLFIDWLLRYCSPFGKRSEKKGVNKPLRSFFGGMSDFVSSRRFKCSLQRGDLAGPLNTYVVDLTFKYNYAHLSHSSACHFVSYQPSIWRAALTDGGLIFHSADSVSTPFQSNPRGPAGKAGMRELLTRSEVTRQGHCV